LIYSFPTGATVVAVHLVIFMLCAVTGAAVHKKG